MTAGRNNAESLSQHWCTPPKYVNAIRKFFSGSIALDPCSNSHSIVRATVEYRLPETDGLAASWDHPTVFVNPPYGSDRERGTTIRDWLRKCAEAHSQHGAEVLALVPVATNTRHWKTHVFPDAAAICFLHASRLRFHLGGVEDRKGAPMSCAVIYWGTQVSAFTKSFDGLGAIVPLVRYPGSTPENVEEPT